VRSRANVGLLLGFLVFLEACGWHFRGSITASLDIESIAIVGGHKDEAFHQRLSQVLERSGIKLTSPANAELTLKFGDILKERKPLTIASDGAVEEYQLYYVVVTSVQTKSGQWLLREQPIEVIRSYRFDRTQVLAKENEERRLYGDMRDDAVRRILQRLKSVKPTKEEKKKSDDSPELGESTSNEN